MPKRVRILSTQYLWKYNPEVNTHTYFRVLAGVEGVAIRLEKSNLGAIYYVVSLDSGDKLKLAPTAVQILE